MQKKFLHIVIVCYSIELLTNFNERPLTPPPPPSRKAEGEPKTEEATTTRQLTAVRGSAVCLALRKTQSYLNCSLVLPVSSPTASPCAGVSCLVVVASSVRTSEAAQLVSWAVLARRLVAYATEAQTQKRTLAQKRVYPDVTHVQNIYQALP